MIAMKATIPLEEANNIASVLKKGERVILSQPSDINFVLLSEAEYEKIDKELNFLRKNNAASGKRTLKDVFRETRARAKENGTANMTMDDINAIIAEERAKDRLEERREQ